jgi:hypothetical protein
LASEIEAGKDRVSGSDRDGDRGDRAGDQSQHKPFVPQPGHQYARNYPDPLTGNPLQVYPSRGPREFESFDDFLIHLEAVSRWNNRLPPPRPMPKDEELGDIAPVVRLRQPERRFKPAKPRHVGLRLTEEDFSLLREMALAHSVRPGTMARMLVVRAVRAAAEDAE